MKAKKELFRRGVRMTQRFGENVTADDPLGTSTFDIPRPLPGSSNRTSAIHVQQQGEHRWDKPASPITKPTGANASIDGPAPDNAEFFGAPIPMSTKKRKQK